MPSNKGVFVWDIEIAPNFASFTFLGLNPDDEPIFFVIHESRDDRDAFYEFMKSVKGLIGYNSIFYDNPILRQFLQGYEQETYTPAWMPPEEVTEALYKLSQFLISDAARDDQHVRDLRFPRDPQWRDLDILKMMSFDKLGIPLKQLAINMRWHRIQDLPFEYDQPIVAADIPMVLDYNLNDVLITRRAYERLQDEVQLRRDIRKLYDVDCASASNSKIANLILEKLMARDRDELTMLKSQRTERDTVQLRSCLPKHLEFTSKPLIMLSDQLATMTVVKWKNFGYKEKIDLDGNTYHVGIGGLHSEDAPGDFRSDDRFIIRDADVVSYYPAIILNLGIKPAHLDERFFDIYRQITKDRVQAKHDGDKVRAAALKICVNSVFGKLGDENFWLYDPKAFLSVTIAGQLYLLKLIEMMGKAGIEVLSANTDGITCRVEREKERAYIDTCEAWMKATNFELEFTDYTRYVRRDVNNYLAVKSDGKTKSKGVFAPAADLTKGYGCPIIVKCLHAYFVHETPIDETLTSERDILDYAMSEKTGRQFVLVYRTTDGDLPLSRNNRYYVSTRGGALIKQNRTTRHETRLISGEATRLLNDLDPATPFEDYEVSFSYYRREVEKIIEAIHPRVRQTALFA